MTDELISRTVVLAECQRVSDEAKGYGIPQMTMGAHACQESIRALPAVQPQVGLDPREVAEWFDGIAKPTAAQSPRHMAANYRDRILADLTPTPVDASPTRNSGDKVAEAVRVLGDTLLLDGERTNVQRAEHCWNERCWIVRWGPFASNTQANRALAALRTLAALEARHD